MTFRSADLLIPAQMLTVILSIVALTLWPSPSGAVLLIPLTRAAADDMAQTVIAAGALLVGSGPYRGSLIVDGDRARIVSRLGWTTLILAAPAAGCRARAVRGVPA